MIDCSIPRYRLDPIEWVPWHVFLVAISLWNDASLCDNESFAIRFIAHVFDKHPEAVCCLITRIPCSGHFTMRDQLVRFAARRRRRRRRRRRLHNCTMLCSGPRFVGWKGHLFVCVCHRLFACVLRSVGSICCGSMDFVYKTCILYLVS